MRRNTFSRWRRVGGGNTYSVIRWRFVLALSKVEAPPDATFSACGEGIACVASLVFILSVLFRRLKPTVNKNLISNVSYLKSPHISYLISQISYLKSHISYLLILNSQFSILNLFHSILMNFVGFVNAARVVWKITVRKVTVAAMRAVMSKVVMELFIL